MKKSISVLLLTMSLLSCNGEDIVGLEEHGRGFVPPTIEEHDVLAPPNDCSYYDSTTGEIVWIPCP